jgi:hypothetical protein
MTVTSGRIAVNVRPKTRRGREQLGHSLMSIVDSKDVLACKRVAPFARGNIDPEILPSSRDWNDSR